MGDLNGMEDDDKVDNKLDDDYMDDNAGIDINDLFTLIRSEKMKEAIEYLHNVNEDQIDINSRDERGIYLLNYAMLQNNLDLLIAILEKNPAIDVLDHDGRGLLYYPIKYNYIKLMQTMLEYNKTSLGINIVDVRDNFGNIPLHYAISAKNIPAIRILLAEESDVNTFDWDGNNAMHLALYSTNYEICEIIANTDVSLSIKNVYGESPLHVACNLGIFNFVELLVEAGANINLQDNEHELAPLHYTINMGFQEISKYLISKKCDPNVADFLGNTVLHYSIVEEDKEVFDYLLTSKETRTAINVNIYNYQSKIPLHLALEKNKEYFYKALIRESNLNFQNLLGNTPLHYIFGSDIWKSVESILRKKKLNIFLTNRDKMRPISYVSKEDLPLVFDIVADSYLYTLRYYALSWKSNWEVSCNKTFFLNNATNKELEEIKKYGVTKKSIGSDEETEGAIVGDEDACKTIIINKLKYIYNNLDTISCGEQSFPVKKNKACIKITQGPEVNHCTYTGNILDILTGLVFLIKKHKCARSTLSPNFTRNDDLCDYYRSVGLVNKHRCDFLNFEIVWIQHKIHFAVGFNLSFINCLKDPKVRFIIMPLGIELRHISHANYLIFDKRRNEMERFEPYGQTPPLNFNYNMDLLDKILQMKFSRFVNNFKYYRPTDYLPKVGLQFLDNFERNSFKIGDPGGFCALWSVWYVDNRIKYMDIDRKILVHKLIKQIKLQNISFRHLIRDYSGEILVVRQQILEPAGITINQWINDEFTIEEIDKVIETIGKMVNVL